MFLWSKCTVRCTNQREGDDVMHPRTSMTEEQQCRALMMNVKSKLRREGLDLHRLLAQTTLLRCCLDA